MIQAIQIEQLTLFLLLDLLARTSFVNARVVYPVPLMILSVAEGERVGACVLTFTFHLCLFLVKSWFPMVS